MSKSDARFEYKAKLGRTDHNLSQPFGFTAAPGMLLPIWYDVATPGDSYYMSHDLPLLRSIQFAAPAMVDVKVHFETFFVPMQMMYQPFENTIFSLKNVQSSQYNLASLRNMNFPLLDFTSFINECLDPQVFEGTTKKFDAFRLCDLLGLSPLSLTSYTVGTDKTFMPATNNFFPHQLLAYQTIYQYYYRLDDKSQFSNLGNVDQFYNSATFYDSNLFFIHQRAWDFDYFSSIYRSPIVSDDNMQSVLNSASYSSLIKQGVTSPIKDYLASSSVTPSGYSASANKEINAFSSLIPPSGSTAQVSSGSAIPGFSTAMIRQMFANEKLAMITGRTKKNYDSQVLAHYGVSVPHDVKHDLTMIHSDVFDLNVQEVTSLASTSDAPLGELAGKSYSAGNGKQFKFTAPCHGIIMTIFSIEPKKRYIAGFDRLNFAVDALSYPTPEFDRLGNVPMYRYEIGAFSNTIWNERNIDIIGWKERYYANKRKYPKVTTAFLNHNGVNNFGSYFVNSFPFAESSIDNTSLMRMATPAPSVETSFYIERGAMDNFVAVPFVNEWQVNADGENWNNTPWLAYSRDPFIVNSHIKCKKVSWMSKDGEPVYNF